LTNLYDEVVEALNKVFEVIPDGVELSKGGLGELALAHHLGHTLVEGDKGADAMDADGLLYEYKVSTTDQYNFSAGGRSGDWEKDKETIEKHFYDIEGITQPLNVLIDVYIFLKYSLTPSIPLKAVLYPLSV